MPKNDKKPIRTEYIAMALLCILVAIFVVILIVISSYKNAHKEESAATSAEGSAAVSAETSDAFSEDPSDESNTQPVGTIQVASSGKTEGILAVTQKPAEGRIAEIPSDMVLVSSKYNKDHVGLSGYSLELKKDAMDALNALLEGFYGAKGKTNLIIDKAYVAFEMLNDQKTQLDLMTGNAVLLSLYPKDPDGDTIGTGKFIWLPDNCNSYGFILRYPSEKAEWTGVTGQNKIYRYVGYAHASYMGKYHLCLEEYLEQIKNATLENPIEITYMSSSKTEKTCSVYYCAASSEDTTRVPVPEGANYAISGNGTDGFVITIYND